MFGPDFRRAVEDLAHDIAADSADKVSIELAREAAEAVLELDRVRRFKVTFITRVSAFGRLNAPPVFRAPLDEFAWLMQHYYGATLWKSRPKFVVDKLPPMPEDEPQRTAEAVRRALPDLMRLHRYERRAAARRDRAIRRLVQRDV